MGRAAPRCCDRQAIACSRATHTLTINRVASRGPQHKHAAPIPPGQRGEARTHRRVIALHQRLCEFNGVESHGSHAQPGAALPRDKAGDVLDSVWQIVGSPCDLSRRTAALHGHVTTRRRRRIRVVRSGGAARPVPGVACHWRGGRLARGGPAVHVPGAAVPPDIACSNHPPVSRSCRRLAWAHYSRQVLSIFFCLYSPQTIYILENISNIYFFHHTSKASRTPGR